MFTTVLVAMKYSVTFSLGNNISVHNGSVHNVSGNWSSLCLCPLCMLRPCKVLEKLSHCPQLISWPSWLSYKTAATYVPSEATVAASAKSVGDASAEVSISAAAEFSDTASAEVSMANSIEVAAAAS